MNIAEPPQSELVAAQQLLGPLQHRIRQLEAIIEHLPCGVAVFDAEQRHVITNLRARQMLNVPAQVLEGPDVTFASLARFLAERGEYGPGDAESLVADRVRRLRERDPRKPERLRTNGMVIEVRGGPMPDGSVVTTYTDVTAERRAASELKTSRERLARALEASDLGLWEYDTRTRKVYLSSGWASMFGLPAQDLHLEYAEMGRFVPVQENTALQDARIRLLKGETTRMSIEHRMLTATGRELWLLTEGQVTARSADGRALKVVGTSKDISVRRRADEALRAALDAADGANRAKSEFLATMSHEIRTPINGVMGLTHLLSDARLPAQESGYIAMIDSCAKSLLSLVDNILDLSKIEAGRMSLEEIPTEIRQLLAEVTDVFQLRAAEKGLAFEVRLAADVPEGVVADPGRLRQILLNLLGNACKFTERGGFSLAVRAEAGSTCSMLAFEVVDSGIGIAPADQARLFARFTQADASTTRRFRGTGLGLAISRQLAQLMGGDVELRSEAGQGSTFTLRIPLRAVSLPDDAQIEPLRRGGCDTVRILLVEDNEVNQLVAQGLLRSMGYTAVTTAADGREAVDRCLAGDFDLVLMDCQMPVMDGLQATRELRALGRTMPILALTASATLGDRERCLEAGMDDYLTKPVEKAVLSEKVGRWTGRSLASEAAPLSGGQSGVPPMPAIFDAGTVSERFQGDLELFVEARALFVQQSGSLFSELEEHIGRRDARGTSFAAHKIKGSASAVGADLLARHCEALERAAATGTVPAPARHWAAQARLAYEQFVEASGCDGERAAP